MNILISSTPKHLAITQTMIEDFLIDPVLGATILFGETLDEFQKARLKLCWWVPRVIDSSGFSSAKTKGLWIVSNLRCLLLGDRIGGVYYQIFSTGQKSYWTYYQSAMARSKIFRAQVGRMNSEKGEQEGKATVKGPSCWTCDYKNGSQIMMPAPGFLQDARSQASIRLNDLYVDEWTKIEATGSTGIDDQLVQRATRHTFNQHHPVWCNHQLFLATAEDTMHPAYERYKTFLEEIKRGNPDYALLSYSFKDYSDLKGPTGKSFKETFREEKVLRDIKKNKSRSGYLQEGLGIWSKNGKGWYSQEMIDAAYALGRERSLDPQVGVNDDPIKEKERRKHVYHFLGIDPAKADGKKSDDGAMVGLRAEPKTERPTSNPRDWRIDFVWAYKVRKADAPQWAAIIHRKHLHFGFSAMMMDYNGGGQWVRPELAKQKQIIRDVETKVKPIACVEDEGSMINGQFILSMFKRGDYKIEKLWGDMTMRGDDNLVDTAHSEFHEAFSLGLIGLPKHIRERSKEEIAGWSEEKVWALKLLGVLARQLTAVCVQTNDDGTTYYSRNGARLFSAKGKKDFAYAALYAYIALLAWLKTYEDEDMAVPEEDADLCG